jgi:hypothetical protein
MQSQVQRLPFRTTTIAESELQIHERAVRTYRAATRSLRSASPELRKARALSQAPSALERLAHQVIQMRFLGATIAELRAIPLMLEALLSDLASPAARGRLMALMREGKLRQYDANLAELGVLEHGESVGELRKFAEVLRAEAAGDLETANEADREARALAGV